MARRADASMLTVMSAWTSKVYYLDVIPALGGTNGYDPIRGEDLADDSLH